MKKLSGISELVGSVCTAVSLQTLRQQWKDMIAMLAPQRAKQETETVEEGDTVLYMRVRLHEWPRGEGTLVSTRKLNFTFGNSDTFDVCLNAGDLQVGDVWCSVFYDDTLNGYVVMQAMGAFNVCVTGDDEPYRHGDWSLYPEGFDYRTIAQKDLLIPIGSGTDPVKTIFHIDHYYFIEMWACKADDVPDCNEEAKTIRVVEDFTPVADVQVIAEPEQNEEVQTADASAENEEGDESECLT